MAELPFLFYDLVAGLVLGLHFLLSPERYSRIESALRRFLNEHPIIATFLLSVATVLVLLATAMAYVSPAYEIELSDVMAEPEAWAFLVSSIGAVALVLVVALIVNYLRRAGRLQRDNIFILVIVILVIALFVSFLLGVIVARNVGERPAMLLAIYYGAMLILMMMPLLINFLTFVYWLRSKEEWFLPSLGLSIFLTGKLVNIFLILN